MHNFEDKKVKMLLCDQLSGQATIYFYKVSSGNLGRSLMQLNYASNWKSKTFRDIYAKICACLPVSHIALCGRVPN